MRHPAGPSSALGLLMLALAGLFAAPALAQGNEGVAVTVNDEIISTYDVKQRMRFILATSGLGGRLTEDLLQRVQEQAINSLIDERLELQQAKEYEVEVEQKEIDEAVADLAKQNDMSATQIRQELAQAGVDARTLEEQLKADIAWRILVNGRYRARVRVSNDQINQMLERYAESVSKPQFVISEILIAPNGAESEDSLRARADAVVQQLRQGAQFAALARQVSAASSAIDGGVVGPVRSGEIKPEIEKVLMNMEPGLSPPIETQDGIYIIDLREKRAASDPERVTLQQVLLPVSAPAEASAVAGAEQTLQRARRGVSGCSEVGKIVERAHGAVASNLGSVAPSDLVPDLRRVVDALRPGEISQPVRTSGGVVLLALCARDRTAGGDLPSREQIEARLTEQQLDQASRRWLRDLRRDATIETRVGP